MVAHHDSIFEEEKVRRASKFLYFCQWPRWGSLGSNWYELREFKVVLTNVVGILTVHGTLPFGVYFLFRALRIHVVELILVIY